MHYLDLGPIASIDVRDAVWNTSEADALLARGTPLELTTDASGRTYAPMARGPGVAVARKGGSYGSVGLSGM